MVRRADCSGEKDDDTTQMRVPHIISAATMPGLSLAILGTLEHKKTSGEQLSLNLY